MILGQLARLEVTLDHAVSKFEHHAHHMENLMSALSDAVARLQADVDKAIELLAQPAPDVAGAVAALNAMSDKLDAIEAPPAPAPTP